MSKPACAFAIIALATVSTAAAQSAVPDLRGTWKGESQSIVLGGGKPRKRLPDSCRAYGIPGWEQIDKDAIARDIGEGRWRKHGQEVVFSYCEEDVRASALLLRHQLCGRPGLPPADVSRVLHWSNYGAKVVAQIQAKGMPIDRLLWDLVQENKAAVIAALLWQFRSELWQ
jgi:hypothetical protein